MKTRLPWLLLMLPLAVLASATAASAQSRTDRICWAENEGLCPPGWKGEDGVSLMPCGSGGHSGFHHDYACMQICGVNPGPQCRITAGPGGPGGRCGYRGAIISCFR